MSKITVAGNATIDAIILGEGEIIRENTVRVTSFGRSEMFRVEDPPIRRGYKHRVNQNVAQKVEGLMHLMQPGGGGYNCATAMCNIPDVGAELELTYIDVSIPHHLINKGLDEYNINQQFFLQRDVPYHAVVGVDGDRIIFKGPGLGRVDPDEKQIKKIERIVSESDSLLIVGVKDPHYYGQYIKSAKQNNVPVYAVVSTSMEKDFVLKNILPNVRCILNWDEIPFLYDITEELDDQSKMELTLDTMRQIRFGINPTMPIVVTAGEKGALYASKNFIAHIYLNEEYAEKVNRATSLKARKNIEEEGVKVSGRGDVFAGTFVGYDTIKNRKIRLDDLMILSSIAAIRHMGYDGDLPRSAFDFVKRQLKPSDYKITSKLI